LQTRPVEVFATAEEFLAAYRRGRKGCLVVDGRLPGMSGMELIERMKSEGHALPAIMITGYGDVPMAVEAMKVGAADFIEKPVRAEELVASIERVLQIARDSSKPTAWREAALKRLAALTPREREVMDLVVAGHANKEIAARLELSQRTVENHRAAVMKRTNVKSLPDLIRLVIAAA
jgi:two-component system, chemotaxis family, CheB/CheR fusion protein